MRWQERHFDKIEEYYIYRCLELAKKAAGAVSPNPLVGSIVLDAKGRKVGEGYHQVVGGPHAEVFALNQAGTAAKGGTLYVNLEPCNHVGKTPACTEIIAQSGIERVVCGTLDPNPEVAGGGRDEMQNHRISVRYGFLEEECLRLNEVFFHYVQTKLPFITLKLALTMDGKIAARNGMSQWITGPLTRQYVHHLRHANDAILTTAETVMADNPELTIRDIPGNTRQPIRIVLDRQCRLDPAQYKIFDVSQAPTWMFVSRINHYRAFANKARNMGVKVIEVDDTGVGLNFKEIMTVLGAHEVTSLMIEAGGHLAGHLMNSGFVNKLLLFYAPKILPDPMAIGAFSDAVNLFMPETPDLEITNRFAIENDIIIEAYPKRKMAVATGPLKSW